MKNLAFICALLVVSCVFSACGHGGRSGNSDPEIGIDGFSMEGDPAFDGSNGAIGVTTIESETETYNYTMIISFGSTPLGTLKADVSAYKMSNGLDF